jgi:hypothetical protein
VRQIHAVRKGMIGVVTQKQILVGLLESLLRVKLPAHLSRSVAFQRSNNTWTIFLRFINTQTQISTRGHIHPKFMASKETSYNRGRSQPCEYCRQTRWSCVRSVINPRTCTKCLEAEIECSLSPSRMTPSRGAKRKIEQIRDTANR